MYALNKFAINLAVSKLPACFQRITRSLAWFSKQPLFPDYLAGCFVAFYSACEFFCTTRYSYLRFVLFFRWRVEFICTEIARFKAAFLFFFCIITLLYVISVSRVFYLPSWITLYGWKWRLSIFTMDTIDDEENDRSWGFSSAWELRTGYFD